MLAKFNVAMTLRILCGIVITSVHELDGVRDHRRSIISQFRVRECFISRLVVYLTPHREHYF